jgi:NTP pyrophosphatase (non-canonical NTP hydrolase)
MKPSDPFTNERIAKAFTDLFSALKLDVKRSPWVRKLGVEGMLRRLVSESSETQMTLEDGFDEEKFAVEMGDVIWVWLELALLAEEKTGGSVTTQVLLHNALEKLLRRKPWIFDGDDCTLTAEDENKAFLALKAKESAK